MPVLKWLRAVDVAIGIACLAGALYYAGQKDFLFSTALLASGILSFALAWLQPAKWVLKTILGDRMVRVKRAS